MDTAGPNAAQIEYWNQQTGPKWVRLQATLDRQLAPLGTAAADRLALATGERVIDVGCGCGESTLDLAQRVGPTGHVLGIDISQPMLARARERAAGLSHVTFLEADAQFHAFEPGTFDALYSRFGVMFFADPPAAFANLRRALRPGGRVGFVCWQAFWENPWMMVPLQAVAGLVEMPPPPPPDAPGPFAFADRDRVAGILTQAGFTDVGFEDLRATLTIGGGGDAQQSAAFAMEIGPAAATLRDADPAVRSRVQDAIAEAFRPFTGPDGVALPGAAWIVTARQGT